MSWLPLRRSRKSPLAVPSPALAARVPRGWHCEVAVPYADDGLHWLLACREGLVNATATPDLGGDDDSPRHDPGHAPCAVPALATVTGWDEISRAAWDAEERTFTFTLVGRTEPVTVAVPPQLRRTQAGRSQVLRVDDERFGQVLRQQVERAIVHYTRTTVGGVRVTASVRRRSDASLYVVTEPPADSAELAAVREEVAALIRRLRSDVGLPTHE